MLGRPSSYTEEIAEAICLEIATTNKGLESICQAEGFPDPRTVYRWIINNLDFSQKYTRAKELQTQLLADEMIPIADTPKPGVKIKETEDGVETTTGDMIEHRKLQIDTRKWILSKLVPKKYGDRQTLEHAGSLNVTSLSDEELAAKLAAHGVSVDASRTA